jgi:hypothetical protein
MCCPVSDIIAIIADARVELVTRMLLVVITALCAAFVSTQKIDLIKGELT